MAPAAGLGAVVFLLGSAAALKSLRVSNLPWTMPVADLTREIEAACDGAGVAFSSIAFNKPGGKRARFHGGSAYLTFDADADAAACLAAFDAVAVVGGKTQTCALVEPKVEKAPVVIDQNLRDRRAAHDRRSRARRRERRIALVDAFRDVPEPRVLAASSADWASGSAAGDPGRGGGLTDARAARKRGQVDAFRAAVPALCAGSTTRNAVDVGSGTGNLALGLAGSLEGVVAVDVNAESLRRLEARAAPGFVRCLNMDAADLNCADLDVDCVLSLHACGAVSDVAMDAAVGAGLPFAVSPCCVGKGMTVRGDLPAGRLPVSANAFRAGRPASVAYPRSAWLRGRLGADGAYADLAAAADFGTSRGDPADVADLQRRAKRLVEYDRLAYAEERGYFTRLLDIPTDDPRYPKRELLLGAPAGSPAALALAALPTHDARYPP